MKRRSALAAAALVAGLGLVTAFFPSAHRGAPIVVANGHGWTLQGGVEGPVPPPNSCHPRGLVAQELPALHCTPGAIDPTVTQANIHETICVRGWTSTVRPPAAVLAKTRRALLVAYGHGAYDTGYELDHEIPLELGGSSDTRNLWAEPSPAVPNPKDGVESHLNALVCSGKITLAAAQRAIATDWTHTP